jgi:hypothetical protein
MKMEKRTSGNTASRYVKFAPVVSALCSIALASCASVFALFEQKPEAEAAKTTTKTAVKETVPYTIKMNGRYPSFDGQDELNTLIHNRVSELYEGFQAEVDDNVAAAKQAGDEHFADGKVFDFDISFEVGRKDQQYISIVMDYQWNAGGAHGNELVESYLWDVRAKKLVAFNDMLKLTGFSSVLTLSVNVRNKFEERLNPGRNTELSRMIRGGTEPVVENFNVFLLENTVVTFYFQRYQVAPGSYGVQKASFPINGSPLIL